MGAIAAYFSLSAGGKPTYGNEERMADLRKFIRHPADIPIEFCADDEPSASQHGLAHDVSFGGLAFEAEKCPAHGSVIEIRIPMVEPPFETRGQVVWCRKLDGHYEVGVRFLESTDAFKTRMVEQVCHIEQYKRDVLEREGRKLSGSAAAREWISKYAADFPRSEGEAA
jgi:hypothetical protein